MAIGTTKLATTLISSRLIIISCRKVLLLPGLVSFVVVAVLTLILMVIVVVVSLELSRISSNRNHR